MEDNEETNEATTQYLLRDIPRDFWVQVKTMTYNRSMTIKDTILDLLAKEVDNDLMDKEKE